MIPLHDFPRLTPENYRITSPVDRDYNCIAWSANDTRHWWQPGIYWPVALSSEEYGIGALAQAFRAMGYADCDSGGDREPGFEKVALFGSGLLYTHAARQLADGKWTSKLGKSVDIEHQTADDVAGGCYGEIVQFMKRAKSADG